MQEQLTAIQTWLGQGSVNIFGMPFAGKDTQGEALADLLEAELMGGGKILRNSVIPPHVQKIMEAGGLVPIADYLNIVLPYLSNDQFAGKPLILSSVGRWDGEQEGVMQATTTAGHPIKAVVLLTVSEKVARDRHAALEHQGDREARADDSVHVFDTRLDEFRQKTIPVIDYYRSHGLLHEVNGDQHPVQVTADILDALYQLATS